MSSFDISEIVLDARATSNWDRVLDYLDHVHLSDRQGKMILHHSYFQQAPLHIIQKVINHHPKALSVQDNFGWTPLHIALLFNSRFEVVEFIAKTVPQAITIGDKYGYTPLHIALERYRPLRIIKLLIDTNPQVLTLESYDENGFSPIDLFNKVWHKGIQEFLQNIPLSISPKNILSSNVGISEVVYTVKYIHDVTCILLNFDYGKCLQNNVINTNESSRLILHSVLSNQSFSWPFCELFLRLYSCQIDLIDGYGNHSFHYMVQSSRENIYSKIFPCDEYVDAYTGYAPKSNRLHQSNDLDYFQALYILMANKPELCSSSN